MAIAGHLATASTFGSISISFTGSPEKTTAAGALPRCDSTPLLLCPGLPSVAFWGANIHAGEMRYRLRTLLIVLALGPPLIALAWWYGKLVIGLVVFALIVCPQLVFELAMLLCHLVGGPPRNNQKDSK